MGSSKKSSDRDKRKRSRSRERERGRERNRSRERDRSKERESGRGSRDVAAKEKSRAKNKDHSSSRKERDDAKKKESSSHRSSRTHDEDDSSRRRQRDKEDQQQQRSAKKERYPQRRKRSRSGSHSGSDETVKRKRSVEKEPPPSEKKSDANDSQSSVVPIVPVIKSSGDASTLSIDQTNQLRASLGMKLLDVGSKGASAKQTEGQQQDGAAPTEEEVETATKKEDVHVPAQNIGTIKTAEKVKDKIETVRETRRIAKKLTSIRTLGEGDGQEEDSKLDDASDWIEKTRRLQNEKAIAQKREALLAEMDEEFGIADLVSVELLKEKERAYTSKHLHGLTVEHKTDAIKEGKQVVLTLKDTKILDDEGDVLVNVNIVDDERAEKNVELRRGKPAYNPYDAEDEVDQWGNLKKQAILKKYGEEIGRAHL